MTCIFAHLRYDAGAPFALRAVARVVTRKFHSVQDLHCYLPGGGGGGGGSGLGVTGSPKPPSPGLFGFGGLRSKARMSR